MTPRISGAEGRVVTVGFMPLLDSALLVAAHEKGFAERQGIRMRLVREVSWANLRDRVAFGHFDAAQMLGPMVVASHLLGQRGDAPLVAPVALGLGGNAITVSRPLWQAMTQHGAELGAPPARQASALAAQIAVRRRANQPPLTLAMVFPFSCHNYQLRDWLQGAGIDPDHDVRMVVVPPPMLVEALRTGQVDGFCVGEPWNSLAVDSGLGTIVATASEIWPQPPEKVLGLREEFLEQHPQLCRALVRAVIDAARWVAEPANHVELIRLLGHSRYVGAPERLLAAALEGRIVPMAGAPPLQRPEFIQLNEAATVPQRAHAQLYCDQIARWRQIAATAQDVERALQSFRPDLHAAAVAEKLDAVPASRLSP
ncbi:MAG TPA: CmpA/NrtA family ABC transporter substrate-binding protein [Steroidobacteraceae bacterium]|nr:CmpA/NrtA family ABC transporter substrate-binding protein [Steroidobacteraceae bacterium]